MVYQFGEHEYDVVKRGVAQAKQLSGLFAWLKKYAKPALKEVQSLPEDGGSLTVESLLNFLGSLSDEALLELFDLVFGCPREVSEEYFDLAVLIDGIIHLYQDSPTIQNLVNRFFSAKP